MKYWKELSVEEKSERTREVVNGLKLQILSMSKTVNDLRGKFNSHDHLDHEIVVPMRQEGNSGMEITRAFRDKPENPDEVYF